MIGQIHPYVPTLPTSRLRRFAWWVLAYNLLVIAWGAFVRATGSGAGCGRHWPLCNGEIVPRADNVKTIIEASHRVTSGIAFALVIALAVWTFKGTAKGHRARKGAAASTVFIFGEVLLGAGLVLFELVAHDASMKRALSMILHLGNTFLLLGALTVTAHALGRDSSPRDEGEGLARDALVRVAVVCAFAFMLVLGASGAIAALGDTLFPARTLGQGLADDASPVAHAFVRLRVIHPFVALVTGAFVMGVAALVRARIPGRSVQWSGHLVSALVVVQLAAGLLNLVLLVPVAMQLVHLLLADFVWIALVVLREEVRLAQPSKSRNGPAPASDVPPSTSQVVPVTYEAAGETR